MDHWIVSLLFIYINLQLTDEQSQASQPTGYIGCFPSSIAKFVNKANETFNNGKFCIGVCKSSGYRIAATKGHYCKCANVPAYVERGNENGCNDPCPGRMTEHCGDEDFVSVYDILITYRNEEMPGPKKTETSSARNVTNRNEETPGPKKTETSSTINGTNASAENCFKMTAGYILLPVLILVPCSINLVVCLILRHMRLKREANVNRREDSSTHFTQDSGENVMSDTHYYQILNDENSLYMESASQIMAAGSNDGAEYITPVHSSDTASYLIPVNSNTAEYFIPVDSNDMEDNNNHYLERDTLQN